MKTNKEYWKQRCLLAESMLEVDDIDSTNVTTSPFEKFNWLYFKFRSLLKIKKLKHTNHVENELFIIDILDAYGKNILSVSACNHELAYENAIKGLETL